MKKNDIPRACKIQLGYKDDYRSEMLYRQGGYKYAGITIGSDVVIGAGSVVTKNIPSNTVAAGNPAKVIKEGIVLNNDTRIVGY